MTSTRRVRDRALISAEAALTGILAMLVDERERRVLGDKEALRTELLLSGAGLSNEEIAAVTRKKPDAVRMLIQRRKGR